MNDFILPSLLVAWTLLFIAFIIMTSPPKKRKRVIMARDA